MKALTPRAIPAIHKVGWGVVNIPAKADTYLIRNLSFPAGMWYVWCPVRIQYGPTPGGSDICFGTPTPASSVIHFQPSTQQPNGGGKNFMDDELCMVGFVLECEKETIVPLQIIVMYDGAINEVMDGDALAMGWLK